MIIESALWPGDPAAYNALIIVIVALIVAGIVWTATYDHVRTKRLHAHAAAFGWSPVGAADPMPGPVAEAVRSRRSKLAFATEQPYPIWLVWQQPSTDSTGQARELTRYFLLIGSEYPDVRVVRRTALGGLFKPVRGAGTGDPAFDRKFLIRGPGGHRAADLVTPQVRAAMLAGDAPAWEITAGVLVASHPDAPTRRTLQPRADALTDLARMLTAPPLQRPDRRVRHTPGTRFVSAISTDDSDHADGS
ncbi:hypothetical protein [Actinomadura verrucosospora]|uniref:Uncharacterized protein n=1 Tax=Actinomadura verrucosospora TaxID=46165 RepID=A0A7D3ZT89_ACTVE|nr:hypothetical protein [Actinomadura verrucosospora]QKG27223.1 hypothetical protein ACTIVE_8876 [Actinomadura verrucosospora]